MQTDTFVGRLTAMRAEADALSQASELGAVAADLRLVGRELDAIIGAVRRGAGPLRVPAVAAGDLNRWRVAAVRGSLILNGTTLADWARAHGYHFGVTHNAVSGRRNGPKARRIRAELLEELGLDAE